jgi:hypothetical protein
MDASTILRRFLEENPYYGEWLETGRPWIPLTRLYEIARRLGFRGSLRELARLLERHPCVIIDTHTHYILTSPSDGWSSLSASPSSSFFSIID